MKTIDEFRDALARARASDRTTAVHIDSDPLAPVPVLAVAGGTCRCPRWPRWTARPPARKTYEAHKAEQQHLITPAERSRLMSTPLPAPAGDRTRLLGRLVPLRPAPGGLAAVPRRGGQGRLPLHRARPAGLPAPGPDPAERRAGRPRPDGQRRHRVRRPAQGQGGPGQGDRGLRPGGEAAGRGGRQLPGAPARAVHRHALRRGHRGRRPGHRAVAEPGVAAPTSWPG